MPKSLYDNSDITANSKQLTLLKQHFPNCFDKEGNFIAHKMEEMVGNEGLELSKESYSLNWLGKSYARLLANENPRTLLKEDKTHNAKEQNAQSENLLIKGDNLEVLKHLTHAYAEQIKMIYIDPPYNTGSDGFVYNDDRKFTVDELSKLAGIDRDESKRILEFTASKANSHSAWLTFMYPRLYVARELLREDGVIFISIDDNEVSQLKLLCDEVFGEENFVSQIIWEKKYSKQNDSKTLSTTHDYILLYTKNKSEWIPNKINRDESKLKGYKNIDDDERGRWQSVVYTCNKTRTERPNLYYPIKNPYTGEEVFPDESRVWAYEKSKTASMSIDNRLWWGKDGKLEKPRLKVFLDEVGKGIVPDTLWFRKDVGSTQDSAREIMSLFTFQAFDTPKPIKLLERIIHIGSNDNDIILDFFAGSGTTAHAVMALNAEDQGNRKFITVQIDEKTDEKSEAYKAGYKSIFDITKARIEKASEALNDKSGFKIFETTLMFEGYLDDLEELSNSATLFNGSTLTSDELETLLSTWKIHDGLKLHEPLKSLEFGTYVAYASKNTVYFMDKGFNLEALQAFVEKLDNDETFEPSKLVLFGYNFDSKHQREFKEALSNYTNKKSIELDMVVRY